MIKHVNMPCTYSSNFLRFGDGTELTGFTPGIRGTARFIVKILEDGGNFKVPGSDFFGDPARYTKCRIQGHYADKPEDQLVSLFCDDLGPLAGIDQAPEREQVTVGEPTSESFQQAKQILESVGLILEKKKTVSDFVEYLKENRLNAPMDDGEKFYCVRKLNEENFDFSQYPRFLEQIKNEGLYDRSFISVYADPDEVEKKFSVNLLPIFGRTDKYETKWLHCFTVADIVEQDFRDRKYGPKKRLDFFSVPADQRVDIEPLKAAVKEARLPMTEFVSGKHGSGIRTTVGYSKEDCDKWDHIPSDEDTRYVFVRGNRYVMIFGSWGKKPRKKSFSTPEKVIAFLKEEIANRPQE